MTENEHTQQDGNSHVRNRVEDLRAKAEDVAGTVKERVEETFERGEECVRYNPLLAVGAALVGGFLLALIAVPRRRTWRERHIDAPIERSQANLVAAALAAGALLRRLADSASSAQRGTMKDLRGYSRSAKKAARRARRKIHLG